MSETAAASTSTPAVVFVEHVLWEPGDEWPEAVAELERRFARATPVDSAAVLAAGALADQLEALATWATAAGVDLDRELGRWMDEHLAMHVRPAPVVTRAVRALARDHAVHVVSALPPRAAESIVRHAGCWRTVTQLHGDVRDAAALGSLVAALAVTAVVAGDATPLPSAVDRRALTA